MSHFRARGALAAILLVYFVLGGLFAIFTPPWQAPDEPAHYNYVRALAETGQIPVLHSGDYPHTYLEELKARRFPPDLSIEPIRYEAHQPPLYYALAAPIYSVSGGSLTALRLFSVLLGAGIVVLAYAVARRAAPGRRRLALAAAAFVAFLPQHLATVSQVGNDVLAELLMAATLYLLVGWLSEPPTADSRRMMAPLRLGLVLGLILITKTTAYSACLLAAGVLLWRWRRGRAGLGQMAREGLALALPAALLGLPWFARNAWAYGWPDLFGLLRHDAIVVGQLRTAEFLAQFGAAAYGQRAVEWTFKSFWGVFGWMGVWLDSRVYFALALVSGCAAVGAIADSLRRRSHAIRNSAKPPCGTQYAVRLLAAATLLTLLAYAGYNLSFVQHQGRYLFTALIPLALAFAAGWREATGPRVGQFLAAGLVLLGAALAVWGVLNGLELPRWPLALTAATAGLLAGATRLPARLRGLAFAAPFAALPLLDLYAIFGAIVPQLR